jgi:hypothetical protein
MAADELDVRAVGNNAHAQCAAAHLVLGVAVVALLDGLEGDGEVDDVLVLGERQRA